MNIESFRYRFLLLALAVQAVVVIWLQTRVARLQMEVQTLVQIQQNVDRALKSQKDMDCDQQKINAIFNAEINDQKPWYRPAPISENCK